MLEWALRSFRNGYAVRPEFAELSDFLDAALIFGRRKFVCHRIANAINFKFPGIDAQGCFDDRMVQIVLDGEVA